MLFIPGAVVESRGSGKVTFPNSTKSGSSRGSILTDDPVSNANPFKMPPDNDIFMLRDKERQKKKQVMIFVKYTPNEIETTQNFERRTFDEVEN